VVLAIAALDLVRSSREFLLVEAAKTKSVVNTRQAIEAHPSVVGVVELLTTHLAPKQILVNAHINFKKT
jgi:Co/Zn/Cd efflux system component